MNTFIQIFVTTALTSGFLYSVIAYLGMRRLGYDSLSVNKKIGDFIDSYSVKELLNIERLSLAAKKILNFIYGDSFFEKFAPSIIIDLGISIALVISLVVNYQTEKHLIVEYNEIQQRADPFLFEMGNNPLNKTIWENAFKKIGYRQTRYEYDDSISVKIRERQEYYDISFAKEILKSANSTKLCAYYMLKGHFANPGFQYFNVLFLFIFNLILDFLSLGITIYFLEAFSKKDSISYPSKRRLNCLTYVALIATIFLLFTIASNSYYIFLAGFGSLFKDALIPFWLITINAIFVSLGWPMVMRPNKDLLEKIILWSVMISWMYILLNGTIYGITKWWKIFQTISDLSLEPYYSLFSIQSMLSLTILFPLVIVTLTILILIIFKVFVEPLKAVLFAYVGFSVQEGSSSYLAALVTLLTILTSFVFAMSGSD